MRADNIWSVTPFPRCLAGFTGIIFAAAAIGAAAVASRSGTPDVGALVLFSALVIFTAHLPVQLSEGVFLSPGLMVCMAAIVVFGDASSVAGAMIVGSLAHVRLSHFNRRAIGWVPFNIGLSALSFLAASLTYAALPSKVTTSMPFTVAAALPVTLVYLTVAWTLIIISYVIEDQRPWRDVLRELVPAGRDVVPFAILGFLLGRLYLELGAGVLLLIIVPIVIAREMFASYMRVKESHDETVHMLIRALETKDNYTAGHSERVAKYAEYMGQEFNFRPGRMERLRFAALMHDIGKLVVPNQILNKPGKLTEEEFARVRIHEKVAVQMLSHIDFLRPIARHGDQMRFDPDDPDHPIEPYMVMIGDAYDAMTSTRSYRKALTQEVAFQELRDKAGTQFHPACVEALVHAIEKRGEVHGAGHEEHSEFENAPVAGLGSAGLGDLLPSEA
jgi:HD domain-containing protein